MAELVVDNQFVCIHNATRGEIRAIERATSYLVAGHWFSPAFRSHHWDGRDHLLRFSKKHGYRAPIGLLPEVYTVLTEDGDGCVIKDNRTFKKNPVEYLWNEEIKMRPYQKAAADAITSKILPGRGILKMPIRSGKTWTVASVIHRLKVRTLILVTSQMLLYQTRDAIVAVLLRGGDIGVIGDSNWKESDITIATIQSLVAASKKKDPRYRKMIGNYDLVVFDECHHLRGDAWQKVMMDFDSYYKIGLSATAYLDDEREIEKGVIWLKACCGSIRYEVSTSHLIKEGYLVKPEIRLYPITEPNLKHRRWSKKLQEQGISENDTRNRKIVTIAQEQVNSGLRVLIISNRLKQIDQLMMLLDDTNMNCAAITAANKAMARRDAVQQFTEGHLNVLVGTVFGEGVDIPEVECVINAEGGRDIKNTIQRMRNLTPSDGKTKAVLIDFMDKTSPYFLKHSKERLKVYRSEPEFEVKLIE